MIEMDAMQTAAQAWFRSLRDRICATFEALEDEGAEAPALPNAPDKPGRFTFTPWERPGGGGGTMGVMKGRVFMCTAGTCGLAMCATRLMPVAKKRGSSAAP